MIHPLVAAGALCAFAGAQSFSYPDFSSTAGLNLLGNAVQTGSTLQLTSTATLQTGWAWRQTAVPVAAGFDTTFTFRITPGAGLAEGMALVIHDDPAGASATGGTIWGMGYGVGANGSTGLRNSIAIELDTYLDGFLGDTSNNEITVHTRGATGNNENESWSIGRSTPAQSFSNAQVHTLRVVYVPGTLEVYYDNGPTPVISRAYHLVTGGTYLSGGTAPGMNAQNGTAYVGFCATTGANNLLTERVEIVSWDWTSEPLSDPCYAGTLGASTLTVAGSDGGFQRRVEVATHQPFGIALADPPAFGGGAPYVLFGSLLPQPGAPGTGLGFGSACFPMLPAGPAELVLADTFGLGAALLPAAPTPHEIAIPLGAVTFPLELTLQAVTFDSASPLTLGLTNAVELAVVAVGPPQLNTVVPLSAVPGTTVAINGSGFVPGVQVRVGGAPVPLISSGPELLQFAYPTNVACDTPLVVTNPDGQSVATLLNPVPTVTNTLLASGPAAGNAVFIIQGTGFAPGTTVTIGGSAAVVLSVTSATVSVRTPAGSAGVAPVVVTTPGGCTVSTSYTYL